MPATRRAIWTIFSLIFLLTSFAVAASALHTIRTHSLPIPVVLSALTMVLPAIAGLGIESATSLQNRSHSIRLFDSQKEQSRIASALQSNLLNLTVYSLTILMAALAALIGPFIGPVDSLGCGLETRWRAMFHAKNSESIRVIQDAFGCCGLHSPLDMAWPFPAKDTPPSTCRSRYDRNGSCFESWRAEERKVAGLMLGVVLFVFLWMIVAVLSRLQGGTDTPWHQTARGRVEDEEEVERVNRGLEGRNVDAIGYHDEEDHAESLGGAQDRLVATT